MGSGWSFGPVKSNKRAFDIGALASCERMSFVVIADLTSAPKSSANCGAGFAIPDGVSSTWNWQQ
jgi:hypothetical protein